MKVIHKFGFQVTDFVTISMPQSARILTVQMQDDGPKLWAIVDPDAQQVHRHFRIYGTGHPLMDGGEQYVGTWQEKRPFGALVWHLFEVV